MLNLAIIVPCYNEQEVLPLTARRLREKLIALEKQGLIATTSKVVFVDDGSRDATWDLIEGFFKKDPAYFGGVKLAKNRGHQNALLCGLLTMKDSFDAIVSLDADLQDDINAIDEMIGKHLDGYEIVFGVRSERKTDSSFKRITAHGYYTLLKFLGVDIVYDHADFRLMGKKSLGALDEYTEVNLFLRGMMPQLGFRTATVAYKREARTAGESKYPLLKMLKLAFEGITSFSTRPIKMITCLGISIFAVSIGMFAYGIIDKLIRHSEVGWASLITSIWAIGGLQLLSIGVIGEYIGKIYMETKRRPRYTVETTLLSQARKKSPSARIRKSTVINKDKGVTLQSGIAKDTGRN